MRHSIAVQCCCYGAHAHGSASNAMKNGNKEIVEKTLIKGGVTIYRNGSVYCKPATETR